MSAPTTATLGFLFADIEGPTSASGRRGMRIAGSHVKGGNRMHCTFIASNLLPSGWQASTSRPGILHVALDRVDKVSGTRSLRIVADGPGREDFVILKQHIRADDYVGRRLQLAGFVKSHEVDGLAALWMRVDAAHRSPVAFDNMETRPVKGTTDWHEYRIVLDVPDDAVVIAFGLRFKGEGRLWVDRFAIAPVGSDVDTTDLNLDPEACETDATDALPRRPVNLDFDE